LTRTSKRQHKAYILCHKYNIHCLVWQGNMPRPDRIAWNHAFTCSLSQSQHTLLVTSNMLIT
jgi:hypothetical protein